jgi:hypothetical protein
MGVFQKNTMREGQGTKGTSSNPQGKAEAQKVAAPEPLHPCDTISTVAEITSVVGAGGGEMRQTAKGHSVGGQG